MYIEKTIKLKLKPDEGEILKKCEALLQEILHEFDDGDDLLCGVNYGELAFTADVLSQLNENKEWY